MATPAAAGTKVTKDQLTYVIKQCPMDADCKGLSWNKKKSGYTKDEAIRNFKEHLYHTHGIKDPSVVEDICDRLKFECYIGKQKVSEPSPPQPPREERALHGLPLPRPKEDSGGSAGGREAEEDEDRTT